MCARLYPHYNGKVFFFFFHIFNSEKIPIPILTSKNDFSKISGYSCRSLFETITSYFKEKNIFSTPIHHTSFKNIIEKTYNNKEIIELNEKMNALDISTIDFSNCDVVILFHLFGQDFNLDDLAKKKQYNF